jgi:hypothetical protein
MYGPRPVNYNRIIFCSQVRSVVDVGLTAEVSTSLPLSSDAPTMLLVSSLHGVYSPLPFSTVSSSLVSLVSLVNESILISNVSLFPSQHLLSLAIS